MRKEKKIVCCILSFFFCLFLADCAGKRFAAHPETSWDLKFKMAEGNVATAAVYDDSGYLISGFSYDINYIVKNLTLMRILTTFSLEEKFLNLKNFQYAWLLKTDQTGKIKWKKRIGSFYTILSMSKTKEGGFILTGYKEDWAEDKQKCFGLVMKLSRRYSVEWEKVIKLENYEHIHLNKAVQSTDKAFIAVGSFGEMFEKKGIIVKLDENGKEIWIKRLGADGTYIEINSIKKLNDGYVVAGKSKNKDCLNKDQDSGAWLAKLNEDGEIIRENIYKDKDAFLSLDKTHDGNIITVAEDRSGLAVNKFDGNFEMIFQKIFRCEEKCPSPKSIRVADNGNIFISGGYIEHGGFVMMLNKDGEEIWQRIFYATKELMQNFFEAIPTKDGGCLAVGAQSKDMHYFNGIAWILKLDANGNCPGCSE